MRSNQRNQKKNFNQIFLNQRNKFQRGRNNLKKLNPNKYQK